MIAITSITPDIAVSAALQDADFAPVSALGFMTVINVLPDGEATGQMTTAEAERAAVAAGLHYLHVPTHKYELFADDVVSVIARTLGDAKTPVLIYCASGQRAAILWAAAMARTLVVDDVLASLRTAGFDLDVLRDDLEAQADRARWADATPAEAPARASKERAAA